jgi:hypothetical protein
MRHRKNFNRARSNGVSARKPTQNLSQQTLQRGVPLLP